MENKPTSKQVEDCDEIENCEKNILEDYNDALEKLSEALENLNQNFKDKLKDAKDAYAEIWHIVNKNNKIF